MHNFLETAFVAEIIGFGIAGVIGYLVGYYPNKDTAAGWMCATVSMVVYAACTGIGLFL